MTVHYTNHVYLLLLYSRHTQCPSSHDGCVDGSNIVVFAAGSFL